MKFIRTPFDRLVQGDLGATPSLESAPLASTPLASSRKRLKSYRQQLPKPLQNAYSWQLCQRLSHFRALRSAKKIALYFPSQGEVNSLFLIKIFPKKTFFLPSLSQKIPKALPFRIWKNPKLKIKRNQQLKKGAFGIPMPKQGRYWRAPALDVIIMPLLAFDAAGQRLGMGKGFYDRTLAFRKHRPLRRPYLLGLAYPFQQQKLPPSQPWDIPLDALAYFTPIAT